MIFFIYLYSFILFVFGVQKAWKRDGRFTWLPRFGKR